MNEGVITLTPVFLLQYFFCDSINCTQNRNSVDQYFEEMDDMRFPVFDPVSDKGYYGYRG